MSMAFIFELKDLTHDKIYQLEPDVPVIVGRGEKFDIHDRTVSRKQIQLEALSDGRCFAERLSENPSLLGTKLLPLKKKVEVKHNDIINLLPGKLPFQLNLPHQVITEGLDNTQTLLHMEGTALEDASYHVKEAENQSSNDEQDIEYTIEPRHGDTLSFSEESSYLGEEDE
ncbi:hypothetical protein VKS41_001844 [Umbelopsis sp. WA50703]